MTKQEKINGILALVIERHKDDEFTNWMKPLAIMEHFIAAPFLLLPIVATVQAILVGF